MSFNDYVKTFQTKIELGCERMSLLLEKLGNPHKDLNIIHISGTNGKGSVCAFLESMLISAGRKVGLYSSPELIDKCEVIRFFGKNIPVSELDGLILATKSACDEVEVEFGSCPSQFEIITACAFMYFKKVCAELVILEVGMGGTGDATNVCDNTKISIITKIDIDHTAYLGETKAEIAKVKAGIIKQNCNVVTTALNEDVLSVLAEEAEKKNARLNIISPFKSVGCREIFEKISFEDREVILSLGGENQLENAALAAAAARLVGIGESDIKFGLENAKHRGRLEKIEENIYFDGAHNIAGIQALKKSILKYFQGKKIVYIMAMMKDKDFVGALDLLGGDGVEFLFVSANAAGREMKSKQMQKLAEEKKLVSKNCNSAREALELARMRDAIIIGCGSLYFYKDFISALDFNN